MKRTNGTLSISQWNRVIQQNFEERQQIRKASQNQSRSRSRSNSRMDQPIVLQSSPPGRSKSRSLSNKPFASKSFKSSLPPKHPAKRANNRNSRSQMRKKRKAKQILAVINPEPRKIQNAKIKAKRADSKKKKENFKGIPRRQGSKRPKPTQGKNRGSSLKTSRRLDMRGNGQFDVSSKIKRRSAMSRNHLKHSNRNFEMGSSRQMPVVHPRKAKRTRVSRPRRRQTLEEIHHPNTPKIRAKKPSKSPQVPSLANKPLRPIRKSRKHSKRSVSKGPRKPPLWKIKSKQHTNIFEQKKIRNKEIRQTRKMLKKQYSISSIAQRKNLSQNKRSKTPSHTHGSYNDSQRRISKISGPKYPSQYHSLGAGKQMGNAIDHHEFQRENANVYLNYANQTPGRAYRSSQRNSSQLKPSKLSISRLKVQEENFQDANHQGVNRADQAYHNHRFPMSPQLAYDPFQNGGNTTIIYDSLISSENRHPREMPNGEYLTPYYMSNHHHHHQQVPNHYPRQLQQFGHAQSQQYDAQPEPRPRHPQSRVQVHNQNQRNLTPEQQTILDQFIESKQPKNKLFYQTTALSNQNNEMYNPQNLPKSRSFLSRNNVSNAVQLPTKGSQFNKFRNTSRSNSRSISNSRSLSRSKSRSRSRSIHSQDILVSKPHHVFPNRDFIDAANAFNQHQSRDQTFSHNPPPEPRYYHQQQSLDPRFRQNIRETLPQSRARKVDSREQISPSNRSRSKDKYSDSRPSLNQDSPNGILMNTPDFKEGKRSATESRDSNEAAYLENIYAQKLKNLSIIQEEHFRGQYSSDKKSQLQIQDKIKQLVQIYEDPNFQLETSKPNKKNDRSRKRKILNQKKEKRIKNTQRNYLDSQIPLRPIGKKPSYRNIHSIKEKSRNKKERSPDNETQPNPPIVNLGNTLQSSNDETQQSVELNRLLYFEKSSSKKSPHKLEEINEFCDNRTHFFKPQNPNFQKVKSIYPIHSQFISQNLSERISQHPEVPTEVTNDDPTLSERPTDESATFNFYGKACSSSLKKKLDGSKYKQDTPLSSHSNHQKSPQPLTHDLFENPNPGFSNQMNIYKIEEKNHEHSEVVRDHTKQTFEHSKFGKRHENENLKKLQNQNQPPNYFVGHPDMTDISKKENTFSNANRDHQGHLPKFYNSSKDFFGSCNVRMENCHTAWYPNKQVKLTRKERKPAPNIGNRRGERSWWSVQTI